MHRVNLGQCSLLDSSSATLQSCLVPFTFLIWSLISWSQTCLITGDLSGGVKSLINQDSCNRHPLLASVLWLHSLPVSLWLPLESCCCPQLLTHLLSRRSPFLVLSEVCGECLAFLYFIKYVFTRVQIGGGWGVFFGFGFFSVWGFCFAGFGFLVFGGFFWWWWFCLRFCGGF